MYDNKKVVPNYSSEPGKHTTEMQMLVSEDQGASQVLLNGQESGFAGSFSFEAGPKSSIKEKRKIDEKMLNAANMAYKQAE